MVPQQEPTPTPSMRESRTCWRDLGIRGPAAQAEACSAWRDKQVLDSTLHNSLDSMPRSTDRAMAKATPDFQVRVKWRALQHLFHRWHPFSDGRTYDYGLQDEEQDGGMLATLHEAGKGTNEEPGDAVTDGV